MACRENAQVDLIVRNGTIYTVNDMSVSYTHLTLPTIYSV